MTARRRCRSRPGLSRMGTSRLGGGRAHCQPSSRPPWLPLLLVAFLAAAALGAESRRLQESLRSGDFRKLFSAVVPEAERPNITIIVDNTRGSAFGSIGDTGIPAAAGGTDGSAVGSGGSGSKGSAPAGSASGGGGSGAGGGSGGVDLMAPVMSGDVSGLFKLLPPNTSATVSPFSLRIDDMAGLVTPKGYPLQQHVIVTGDGYKLGTFRIPYGRAGPGSLKRPPVLLIHGISLASTCWVVNEPSQSLAFILADRGYDVWMMNTRGNTFSREHVLYSDAQPAFWRFGVDEMAAWDLRENIKYIQDVTGVSKVGLVGHSQGGSIALMALADDPYLADSVSVLVALGPCAYVKYMASVILKNFCRQANTSAMFNILPPQELIYMSAQMQQTFLNGVCQVPTTMLSCLTTMEGIFGTSRRITAAQYRRYWQIWPSSTSLGNALQWAEIYNEPRPRFFHKNYGAEYRLENIRAPVIMVSGGADVLAAQQDIVEQKKRLRNVLKKDYYIPDYSHMDFIWDTGAANTVYPIILDALASNFA